MKVFLVLGATSTIAQATMRHFAPKSARFYLVGRQESTLNIVAQDLLARGAAEVEIYVCQLADSTCHASMLERAWKHWGGFDCTLLAFGSLPDQQICQQDWQAASEALEINFVAPTSLLHYLAHYYQRRGSGTIAIISSVAGDRGRQSNSYYGAAKAGLNAFASGLRGQLASSGIRVLTIKPGMVDTRMTAHLPKNLLFASAQSVGKDLAKALRRNSDVIYLPSFWRLIMLVIKCLPEGIFKRLKF